MTIAAELDEAPPAYRNSPSGLEVPLACAEERGRLPVTGLVGVATGGAFAVWASLTCFVC